MSCKNYCELRQNLQTLCCQDQIVLKSFGMIRKGKENQVPQIITVDRYFFYSRLLTMRFNDNIKGKINNIEFRGRL